MPKWTHKDFFTFLFDFIFHIVYDRWSNAAILMTMAFKLRVGSGHLFIDRYIYFSFFFFYPTLTPSRSLDITISSPRSLAHPLLSDGNKFQTNELWLLILK